MLPWTGIVWTGQTVSRPGTAAGGGLYAHASQRMRDELTADLQARWEESLRERAAIDPHSTVRFSTPCWRRSAPNLAGTPGRHLPG